MSEESDSYSSEIRVLARTEADEAAAHRIASELGLETTSRARDTLSDEEGLVLEVSAAGLALAFPGPSRARPVAVDFCGGAFRKRLQSGGREPLIKALRGKRTGALRVIDATAGLGVDAFLAAHRGLRVTMIERNAVLCAMLEDGLARAARIPGLREGVERLHLVRGESIEILPELSAESPIDAILLDPMFPKKHGKNTALPGREMQVLRRLLPAQLEADHGLLDVARAHARRVVVKRARNAPWLEGFRPTRSIEERSCRYDIYLETPATEM